MPKVLPFVADLGSVQVRYSARKRPDRNCWVVIFVKDGELKRIATTHEVRSKNPPVEFHTDAIKIIRSQFDEIPFVPQVDNPLTWEQVLEKVESEVQLRSETIRGYKAAVKAFTKSQNCPSPQHLTEQHVNNFIVDFLSPKHKSVKTGKPRSKTTLSYYVRSLSGLYVHLISLGLVKRNLWNEKIKDLPKPDKVKAHVPDDEETNHFFEYLKSRYPNWKSLHLFIELKALTGCRSADICQLRSKDLKKGILTFPKEITKNKEDRPVPLPPDLAESLSEIAGETYLWEVLFNDISKYRKTSNGLPKVFSWKTVYFVTNNIFREYREQTPDKTVTAHGLRRRAVTIIAEKTGSIDAAAAYTDMTPENARRIYLDHQKAFNKQSILEKVSEALRPINAPKTHQNDSSK